MMIYMVKGRSFFIILRGFLFFGIVSGGFFPVVFAGPGGGGGGGGGGGPVCPPACPPNAANCEANLVITETQSLQFGSISAPTAGTVIIDTAGVRTFTGGIVLVGAGGAAASFSMNTGSYNCTGRALVVVTAGPTATLTHATLPASMTVDTFTTSLVAGDAFDPTIPLTVGATLNVGTSQTPGTYTGTYPVTVSFQ